MRSSSWTLCANVVGVKNCEPNSGGLGFNVKGTNKTVYFEEILVDDEDPVNLVEWLLGENFDKPKFEYSNSDDETGQVFITFSSLDDALRFKTSFGSIVCMGS